MGATPCENTNLDAQISEIDVNFKRQNTIPIRDFITHGKNETIGVYLTSPLNVEDKRWKAVTLISAPAPCTIFIKDKSNKKWFLYEPKNDQPMDVLDLIRARVTAEKPSPEVNQLYVILSHDESIPMPVKEILKMKVWMNSVQKEKETNPQKQKESTTNKVINVIGKVGKEVKKLKAKQVRSSKEMKPESKKEGNNKMIEVFGREALHTLKIIGKTMKNKDYKKLKF